MCQQGSQKGFSPLGVMDLDSGTVLREMKTTAMESSGYRASVYDQVSPLVQVILHIQETTPLVILNTFTMAFAIVNSASEFPKHFHK